VNLEEKKSAVLNAETQPYTIADLVSTIGTGAQGPQGVEGPAGPPGPVGPAGLEWQGQWVSGASYVEDDAVGYGGASWFCILATSGTDAPDADTTHWALLASQGAIGPQGVQGPTGPQGPSGSFSYTEGSLNADSSSFVEFTKLEQNFTRVYVSSPTDNYIGISNVGLDTGSVYVVQNKSTVNNLIVRPVDNAKFLQTNGFDTQSDFTVKANTYARFTLVDNTSGSDKVFMVEVINPLGMSNSHKSYVSTVQFNSSGDPLVTTVYSDIQDGVDITTTGTGVYQISSLGRFTSNKTIITPFADQGTTTNSGAVRLPIYSSNVIVGYYWLQRITASQIRLNFVDTSSNPINPNTLLGSRKIIIDLKVYN
jgi:hypothetical protein